MLKNRKTKPQGETGIFLPESRNGCIVKRHLKKAQPAVKTAATNQPWSETRSEMVERAKKLVGDANYPPRK